MEKRNELVHEFLKANIAFTNFCMCGLREDAMPLAIRLWRACINLAEVWQEMQIEEDLESFATVGEIVALAEKLQKSFSLEANDLSSEKYVSVGRRRYLVEVGDYVIVGRDWANGQFFLERAMVVDFWGTVLETQRYPDGPLEVPGEWGVYAINHHLSRKSEKWVRNVCGKFFGRQDSESLGFGTLEHVKQFLTWYLDLSVYPGLQVLLHLKERNPTYRDVILSEEEKSFLAGEIGV